MKIITCTSEGDPQNCCPDALEQALQVLRDGGIVAHPTDTCYALAVDITNEKALKKLYTMKGLPKDKPVSILVGSLEEAQEYGEFCDLALRLANEFWPGPLTLVVPRKKKVPKFLNPEAKCIGIRVIDSKVANALIKDLGGPVTTTSANHHGAPTPFSADDISAAPDLLIDVGDLEKHTKPSTVLHVENDQATTLRPGNLFDLYLKAL